MRPSQFELMASPRSGLRAGARLALQLLAVGAVLVAAYLLVVRVSPRTPVHDYFDLHVYRGAVRWWLDGRPLYDFLFGDTRYGFTYPPFAAVLLAPLALLSEQGAERLALWVSVLLVAVIAFWLLAPVARRHGWPRWFAGALAVPVVLALEPIRETLGYGQLNIVLFALVLADLSAVRRGRPWAGVGIGLATAVKLTPGLFVVYLLLTRRFRATAVAAGTFLAATVVGFVVDERASWTYWTDTLWQTHRVGRLPNVNNQSLMGALARAGPDGVPDRRLWALLVVVVLVVALWRAVRASRCGDELAGFTLIGLTTCVISPITWTHHLYWIVPALVVLADVVAGTPVAAGVPRRLRRRRWVVGAAAALVAAAVLVVFGGSIMWIGVPPPGTPARDHSAMLGGDLYIGMVIALVVLLPARRLNGSAAPSAVRTTAQPRPAGSSPR